MGLFPAHIFISFSALAKSPSSAHLFLQGCRVHDHRLPGRGDDDHPGLRQVRVVPRPVQEQHGEPGLHQGRLQGQHTVGGRHIGHLGQTMTTWELGCHLGQPGTILFVKRQ